MNLRVVSELLDLENFWVVGVLHVGLEVVLEVALECEDELLQALRSRTSMPEFWDLSTASRRERSIAVSLDWGCGVDGGESE